MPCRPGPVQRERAQHRQLKPAKRPAHIYTALLCSHAHASQQAQPGGGGGSSEDAGDGEQEFSFPLPEPGRMGKARLGDMDCCSYRGGAPAPQSDVPLPPRTAFIIGGPSGWSRAGGVC